MKENVHKSEKNMELNHCFLKGIFGLQMFLLNLITLLHIDNPLNLFLTKIIGTGYLKEFLDKNI